MGPGQGQEGVHRSVEFAKQLQSLATHGELEAPSIRAEINCGFIKLNILRMESKNTKVDNDGLWIMIHDDGCSRAKTQESSELKVSLTHSEKMGLKTRH